MKESLVGKTKEKVMILSKIIAREEDEPFDKLIKKYPECRAALRS